MPFVGLTKPAVITTPGHRERLCYDFHRNLPVAIGPYQGWLSSIFLETHCEPFIEHFPETLPRLRFKRIGQRGAL
jgi:hypothetical protein